mgnify:CR=1 FL=1
MGGGPSIVFKPFQKVIESIAAPVASPRRPEVRERSIAKSETRPLKKTEPKKLAKKRMPGSRKGRRTGMMSNYEAELAAETTRNPIKITKELGVE